MTDTELLSWYVKKARDMRPDELRRVADLIASSPKGPMATVAERRPANFRQLGEAEQWETDKALGILDWDGSPES